MNIFCLDRNPKIAAQYNCDRHVGKIFLEICQMLTYLVPDEMLAFAPKTKTGEIRKKPLTHYNHPVSKFVRATEGNLNWVLEHAYCLDEERIWRSYGKKKEHFSKKFLEWFEDHRGFFDIPSGELTEFSVAINENTNCRKQSDFDKLDVIEQYRQYYIHDKPFVKWNRRGVPFWFNVVG